MPTALLICKTSDTEVIYTNICSFLTSETNSHMLLQNAIRSRRQPSALLFCIPLLTYSRLHQDFIFKDMMPNINNLVFPPFSCFSYLPKRPRVQCSPGKHKPNMYYIVLCSNVFLSLCSFLICTGV